MDRVFGSDTSPAPAHGASYLLRCMGPVVAQRVTLLARSKLIAIGAKRTCRERRERGDLTRLPDAELCYPHQLRLDERRPLGS
jgi:hypothetical protein